MDQDLEWLLDAVGRVRVALAALGVLLSALFLASIPEYNFVKIDYLAWAAFVAVFSASFADLRKYAGSYGYASTLTLDLLAISMAVIGRAASSAISMWTTGITAPIIGGGISGLESIGFAALMIPASVICIWATIVHTANRKPISFGRSVSYSELFRLFWNRALSIGGFVECHPVVFGFAFGFAVRLIPELLWWPWLIGWDTPYYVANLEDFLLNPNPFAPQYSYGWYRNTPPMLDLVLSAPAALAGGWITYKIFPPVAYGTLCSLSALVASRALRMEAKHSLLSAVLSALFILNLRISWDYQKQAMGTLFLMGFIALSEKLEIAAVGKQKRNLLLAVLLLAGAAFSSEVTAFASFLAGIYLSFASFRTRRAFDTVAYALSTLASAALLIWYAKTPVYSNTYLGAVPVGLVPNFSDAAQVVSYFVAGFGLVLPLAFLGMDKANRVYQFVVIGLIISGLSPLLAPYTSVQNWYRFLIQVAPLSIPLAVKALSSHWSRGAVLVFSLMVILPGIYYLSPNGASYTNAMATSLREFPQNMVPAPAGSNAEALMEGGQKAAELVRNGSVPLVVTVYDGRFVHLYLRNPNPNDVIYLWSLDGHSLNATMSTLGVDGVFVMSNLGMRGLNSSLLRFSYIGEIFCFNITPVWQGEKGFSIYYVTRLGDWKNSSDSS